jgi:hypothetical protein
VAPSLDAVDDSWHSPDTTAVPPPSSMVRSRLIRPTVARPPRNPDRSSSQVSAPRRAAASAAAIPADPAPTTSTSGRPITGSSRAGSRQEATTPIVVRPGVRRKLVGSSSSSLQPWGYEVPPSTNRARHASAPHPRMDTRCEPLEARAGSGPRVLRPAASPSSSGEELEAGGRHVARRSGPRSGRARLSWRSSLETSRRSNLSSWMSPRRRQFPGVDTSPRCRSGLPCSPQGLSPPAARAAVSPRRPVARPRRH